MLRIGCGFDVHPFKAGRKLILGGVEIPHSEGLDGHSDADVITHAVMDAILGAIANGDIGDHFPDDDPDYKNVKSINLLRYLCRDNRENALVILSVDVSIAMEKPHLAKYRKQMRENLADAINTPVRRVSVKATTCEKLGFVGRGEGAAAFAVVLVNDNKLNKFYADDPNEEEVDE